MQFGSRHRSLVETALGNIDCKIHSEEEHLADQLSRPNQVLPINWSLLLGCPMPSVSRMAVLTWTCLFRSKHEAPVICVFSSPYHGLQPDQMKGYVRFSISVPFTPYL